MIFQRQTSKLLFQQQGLFTRKMLIAIHGATHCHTHIVHILFLQHLFNSRNWTFRVRYASLPLMKGIFIYLHTNYSHIINIWYVGFIKCYDMLSLGLPINNHLSQRPFPIGHDTIVKQYKMQSPTWSSPSQSSIIASCGHMQPFDLLQWTPHHCLQDHIQLLAIRTYIFLIYSN